jgi:hypothetical protein
MKPSRPSRKDRRSKRIPASQRLLLTILGPTGLEVSKEIVTTVEVSLHGARVRGIRTFRPDSQGVLTQLSSGQAAPVRIAWQTRAASNQNLLDTGVEFLSAFDFWGMAFSEPPAPGAAPPEKVDRPPINPKELLEELDKASESADHAQRARTLEVAWCGLIDQLEERNVLSRDELLASLRSISRSFNSSQEI